MPFHRRNRLEIGGNSRAILGRKTRCVADYLGHFAPGGIEFGVKPDSRK